MPITNEEIKTLRKEMSEYRISQECIDHVMMEFVFCMHTRPELIPLALDAFDDKLTYYHEPDHKVMEALSALDGRKMKSMRPFYPRDNMVLPKRGNPETTKEHIAKVKACLAEMVGRGRTRANWKPVTVGQPNEDV